MTEIFGFLLRSVMRLHPFCATGASSTDTSLANFGFHVYTVLFQPFSAPGGSTTLFAYCRFDVYSTIPSLDKLPGDTLNRNARAGNSPVMVPTEQFFPLIVTG